MSKRKCVEGPAQDPEQSRRAQSSDHVRWLEDEDHPPIEGASLIESEVRLVVNFMTKCLYLQASK
jgi:hypothetical protein